MFLRISKRSSKFIGAGVLLAGGIPCLSAQKTIKRPVAASVATNSTPSVGEEWTTYNGDISGRRFSTLKQIHRENVKSLTLAWAFPTHGPQLKGTPLVVNGIMYLTAPDKVWAIDARSGQQVWQHTRISVGNHIGQRGVAFYQDRLYFGTPDAHLVCIRAKDGKQLWDVEIADKTFGYYLSAAPIVVKGHVLIGTSGDQANVPHFLESRDWETGAKQWRTESLPKPGAPGSETWPDAKSMSHGGGPMWLSGTYDAALNLVYVGTGNPHPVLDGLARKGDNLFTSCILAINPDTGAIVWYFQVSPHDTHDFDAVETTILFDGDFKGKPRKMLAQASRNGFFFLLDRQTGENLLTSPFVPSNWTTGIDSKGRPIPDPMKEPQLDGALVHQTFIGATSWMPPSFDPETKMLYVSAVKGYSYWHLVLDENNEPEDHQGGASIGLTTNSELIAIDYQTGKVQWTRASGAGVNSSGILTTAGHVLFTGDALGNLLALDPTNGGLLWHTRGGANMSNGPMTYMLDGKQYVATGVGDMLYVWSLPEN
ncbi:acido-empty-quinoprotein group A [Terriglobus saanensis]|uniref:PQQ-dependent enzyme-like protein n=1 Tax=Terriglobus saanensis (strain ATCC BAA-1853 / DSM 23119 / SP1PR4) TaxID=401053 RepID=E8V2N2_TERSS|nr:acido-empty-quinoprotein group A [Terriglobus saanensis]ADV83507.1 PQQ-dependent enzyme-like protein [Terriglobus saanensis SP1PR4]